MLYRQIVDREGEARASLFLGELYSYKKDAKKAKEYFEKSLKLSRELKKSDLEAGVLSDIGQAYQNSGMPDSALEYYKNSASVYHGMNDLENEALQLNHEAWVLNDLHKTDEAFETALKAKQLADTSGSWSARYLVRRTVTAGYVNRGEFEKALTLLQETIQISDSAHQQLSSAQARLALAEAFVDVGGWEQARDAVNVALPIFRQFKDTDSEITSYIELMDIYGARESDLKDFDKALENYEAAYRRVRTDDPGRAVQDWHWTLKRSTGNRSVSKKPSQKSVRL